MVSNGINFIYIFSCYFVIFNTHFPCLFPHAAHYKVLPAISEINPLLSAHLAWISNFCDSLQKRLHIKRLAVSVPYFKQPLYRSQLHFVVLCPSCWATYNVRFFLVQSARSHASAIHKDALGMWHT